MTDSMNAEFEHTPGDSEGQGGLVCCSSWAHRQSDTTEGLNNNNTLVYSRNQHNIVMQLTFN